MVKKYFRKRYRIKKRRSIFFNRFFWISILILIIIGAIFYFFIFSSTFQIQEIKIFGNEKVSKEKIQNLIEKELKQKILFFPTRSIFLINSDEIKKEILEKFPQIEKINLEREYLNALIITITERQPAAIFNQNEKYFFIDKEGIIYEEISEISSKMLIIKNSIFEGDLELGNEVIKKEALSQILDIEKKLNEFDVKIQEFTIVSEERLNARTFEDWKIYFNQKEDLNWQITELTLVLEKQIPPEKRGDLEYIDLRFSKVFYKYR